MSVQFKKPTNFKKIGATTALVIGASVVILKTFPHLKSYIYGKTEEIEDNEPIELNEEEQQVDASKNIAEESIVDINEMSTDDLKDWLKKVRIMAL